MSGNVAFIITYFRKGFECLTQCLDSVSQNVEPGDVIILVDDFSEDGVVQSIDAVGLPIKIVSSSVNLGAGGARNLGVKNSSSEYVQFVDSDDLLHPNRTKILRNVLDEKDELQLISSGYTTFTEREELFWLAGETVAICEKPVQEVPYLPAMSLFRRSFLNDIGLFSPGRRWMDLEYHARIASIIDNVTYLGLPLYAYRLGVPNQVSSIVRDSNGEAFESFSQAITHLGYQKSKSWLYPLATTLARQTRLEPISRRKMKAFSYPILLAPDRLRSAKWTVWALFNFFNHD